MDEDLNQEVSRKINEHTLLLKEKSMAFKNLAHTLADDYAYHLTEKQDVGEDQNENKQIDYYEK
jgi:hypothetical protein